MVMVKPIKIECIKAKLYQSEQYVLKINDVILKLKLNISKIMIL